MPQQKEEYKSAHNSAIALNEEIRVEGKRKSLKDSATNYTETPPQLTTLKPSTHRLKQCTWVKNLSLEKDY